MFEKAARLKLRFESPVGILSVEDLWDLPLLGHASLDNIAKSLNEAVKSDSEESFVVKPSAVNARLQLQFDIVKHVITVKLAEAEAAESKLVLKVKKDRILALLVDKENDELRGKSSDELKDLLDSLD